MFMPMTADRERPHAASYLNIHNAIMNNSNKHKNMNMIIKMMMMMSNLTLQNAHSHSVHSLKQCFLCELTNKTLEWTGK